MLTWMSALRRLGPMMPLLSGRRPMAMPERRHPTRIAVAVRGDTEDAGFFGAAMTVVC